MQNRNILFIMADQLRWDYLSCYGHPHLKTPNIDWLASKGVKFNNAYVQSQLSLKYRMSDDAEWLSISGDLSGDLDYSESTALDITAQASDLPSGEYFGEIIVFSNSQSAVNIPVSLLVVVDDGLLGDVNGDGVLNVLDVVTLVNIILGGDAYILAGDMNQDGALDVLDIVTLVNIILS